MQKTKEVYETAINLARVWGVMEALEDIPSMKEVPTTDENENMESILSWAEEFIVTKAPDMLEFMKEKLNKYKK